MFHSSFTKSCSPKHILNSKNRPMQEWKKHPAQMTVGSGSQPVVRGQHKWFLRIIK